MYKRDALKTLASQPVSGDVERAPFFLTAKWSCRSGYLRLCGAREEPFCQERQAQPHHEGRTGQEPWCMVEPRQYNDNLRCNESSLSRSVGSYVQCQAFNATRWLTAIVTVSLTGNLRMDFAKFCEREALISSLQYIFLLIVFSFIISW